MLGNLLGLQGFDADTSEQVRDQALAGDVAARLAQPATVDLAALGPIAAPALPGSQLERVAHVMPYGGDPVLRRANSLQQTRHAQVPPACIHPDTLAALGLAAGDVVRVEQGSGAARVTAVADAGVAPGVVWLATAHAATAGLASMFGAVSVRKD